MPKPRIVVRLSRASAPGAERPQRWEELVAVGIDDLDLARLNLANPFNPSRTGASRFAASPATRATDEGV
jgi:hypothetical protein